MSGLSISLLLKLVLWNTLPGCYQFALRNWVLKVKLFKEQLILEVAFLWKTRFTFGSQKALLAGPVIHL